MNDLHQPLTDDELHWLDEFLLDRVDEGAVVEGQDEGILGLSELDGFLTAVVSGPMTILPSQWLPRVWGEFEPVWKDEQEVQRVLNLLMRHMNGIAVTLMEQPDDFEPIFLERRLERNTYTIVDEWCEGYALGVALAAEQWQLDVNEVRHLLAPIMAFQGDQALELYDRLSETEISDLQDAIPLTARKIHAYWLSRRGSSEPAGDRLPLKLSQPKVGRNDPCPCGSGKKYKKCCLH